MKEIFDKARGLPPAERGAFVRAQCDAGALGEDETGEVLALLDELEGAGGFLEVPNNHAAGLVEAFLTDATPHEGVGSRIGPYKPLEAALPV